MKGCRQARRRLWLEADGELPLEETLRLDEHVARCAACAELRGRLRALHGALQALPEPPEQALDADAAVEAVRARLARGPAPRGPADRAAPPAAPVAEPVRTRRRAGLAAAGLAAASLAVAVYGAWPRSALDAPTLARADGAPATEHRTGGPDPSRPGAPAAPELARGDEPDRDDEAARLAGARARVREALLASTSEADAGSEPRSIALRFERLAAPVGQEGYSLARLAEDLLGDPDPAAARAAARYLGVRGDRVSAVALRAALGRADVARAVVLALGDLGAAGVRGLADALQDPDLRPSARDRLAAIGGPDAARALEERLHRVDPSDPEAPALLDGLARCGPAALPALLRAGEAGIARLSRVPEGAAALLALCEAAGPGSDVGTLLEAVAALRPEGALPWLESRSCESEHGSRALSVVAEIGGEEAWEVFVRLQVAGRVPDDALVAAASRALERDPDEAVLAARARIAAKDAHGAEELSRLFFACADPAASGALVELVRAPLLPDDTRQWAALAVGELAGGPGGEPFADAAAEGLALALEELAPRDRRLHAACLVAIHALRGERGVRAALARQRLERIEPVLAVLDDLERAPGGAVGLQRVVRSLDRVIADQRHPYARSTP